MPEFIKKKQIVKDEEEKEDEEEEAFESINNDHLFDSD